MKQYVDLVCHIIENGQSKDDRTNTGTQSVFGYQNRYNLQEGFPLLGLKKTFTRGVFAELLWFIKGDTNIKYLVDNNVHIWDEWAYERFLVHSKLLDEFHEDFHIIEEGNTQHRPLTQKEFIEKIKSTPENNQWVIEWGDLGPVYGKQWVKWDGARRGETNQLDELINGLKNNPYSRRHIISAWNVDDIPYMALAPCHAFFQFNVVDATEKEIKWALKNGYTKENVPSKKLDCQLYQRSADVFLGVPFNIASYALLTHLIAAQCNMLPGNFVHTFGDAHLYSNHREQVNEFLNRTHISQETLQRFKDTKVYEPPFQLYDYYEAKGDVKKLIGDFFGPQLPTLELNPNVNSIYDYVLDDIKITNYSPLPPIKAPVAV